MHHRSYSGATSMTQSNNHTAMSCSSSQVRSLVDSPGDNSHSDDSSDMGCNAECELDSDIHHDGSLNDCHGRLRQGLHQQDNDGNSSTKKGNDRNRQSTGQGFDGENKTPEPAISSTPWSSAATAASASVSSSDPQFILLLGRQHSFDSPMAVSSLSNTTTNTTTRRMHKHNDHYLGHGGANSSAPLVLGSSCAPAALSKQQSMTSSSSSSSYLNNPKIAVSNQKNEMLKNLLSNVQFPRPRMSFPPLAVPSPPRETLGLSMQEETRGGGITAASFAKCAPKAGYLSKLGNSVSEYKKRFFVLKPTTCLYYFLSPSDEEPRGCIDLDGFVDYSTTDTATQSYMEGLKVNSLGTLPDGRFRFECVLPPTSSRGADGEKMPSQKILLEARNEEIGKEWMQALTVERLSYSKAQCQLLQDQLSELEKETKIMEQRIEELHLVEKDLEGALQDAQIWKNKAEEMNQAMYLLKRYLITHDKIGNESETISLGDKANTSKHDASNDASYFFTMSEEEVDFDSVKLPGTHFSSLVNVCRGLRENLRLTAMETSSNLEDLKKCNEKLKEREEQLEKAEKYVCKLWEENCAAREIIRRRKCEKKILVNEIRSLHEKSSHDDEKIAKLEELNRNLIKLCAKVDSKRASQLTSPNIKKEVQSNRCLATPEMKLLSDLEDQINTTLEQHEYLLFDVNEDLPLPGSFSCPITSVGTGSITQTDEMSNTTNDSAMEGTVALNEPEKENFEHSNECRNEKNSNMKYGNSTMNQDVKSLVSPLLPKQLSLMDQLALDEIQSITSASTLDEIQKHNDADLQASDDTKVTVDRRDVSNNALKSVVTDYGTATSKIACPLMDVQQSSPTAKLGDGKVYSLTFYTARIGLQFQKVPSNSLQNGLLNDVMRVDIGNNDGDSATETSRTEAELRVIASLSGTKSEENMKSVVKHRSCPVIFPKHIVLVCGFEGFDEAAGNRRPSLGARLVGFDGISIERGPWTFEAVRKAIKAAGRPLTLTFRDDFLTHEQRAILTRAIGDVEISTYPGLHLPQDRQYPVPSTIKTHSHQVLENMSKSSSYSAFPQDIQSFDDGTAITDTSRLSDTCRSYSDAGSSSIFSSKFSPLVTSLIPSITNNMNGTNRAGKKNEEKVVLSPDYFRRSIDSLECTPHHKEFKANLL